MPVLTSLSLERARTALLSMDFQRDIVGPSALSPHDAPALARLGAAVVCASQLIARAREVGMLVIHVRVAFRPGHPEVSPYSPMMSFMKSKNLLVDGADGTGFDPRVAPREDEPIVTKRGVGSFTGTDLGPMLRARGIERLLLTGLVTHYVVAGTAREAHDLGLGFVVVSDAVASASPERHEAALRDLAFLGDIASSELVLEALR